MVIVCKHISSAMKSEVPEPIIGEFQRILFDVCCDPPNPSCGFSPRSVVCEGCSEYYQRKYDRELISHFEEDEEELLVEIDLDPEIGRVPTCSECYLEFKKVREKQ